MKRISFVLLAALLMTACNPNTPDLPKDAHVGTQMQKSAKRGACFDFKDPTDMALMTDAISWYYNWGSKPSADAAYWFELNGVDFCPMCWNGSYSKDLIRNYVAEHPSTKYLLAFNEPNLTDQANMVPSKAAELWPDVVALAKELNLKLVAPAMNYGTLAGYHDPIKWMDEFLQQPDVSLNDIDAMALHCYMTSVGGVVSFVESFYKYNKPIWMTEICAWDAGSHQPGSLGDQMSYMTTVLNYFEQNERVERYAWFMPRTKSSITSYPFMQLLTHDEPAELTELGKIHNRFSSFDKSTYFDLSKPVYAGCYVGLSDNTIPVRVSPEDNEHLVISPLSMNEWTEYNVYAPESLSALNVRYATLVKSRIAIDVDGTEGEEFQVTSSGGMDVWGDMQVPVKLSKGYHTIRVRVTSGGFNFGWFSK